jgi:PTS system galactitol-specific IIC component
MSTTNIVISKIIEIGPIIIIPSILFIIGLVTTRNPLKNLRNCIFVLIGMMSLAILLTIFVNFFKPIIDTIIANSPKKFEILDVGWLASKQVILNSPITLQIIIAVLSLNIIMILFRLTRTINIDLWNYWIFLVAGSIIFTITEIRWAGVLISLIVASITLVLADIYAPFIGNYFGIKGVSNPQTQTITWAPVSHLVNFIINKIPFIKKIHIFYEEIQYKLGIFSEPMILGFVLGFIVGIITKYRNFQLAVGSNLIYALISGIKLSFIMILLPRAVNILMKGLYPAINDIRSFINRRITKRVLYIGLDSIFFAGHPSTIALSAIMIPLTVYISTILPGSKILPSADLIMIPFILIWVIAPSRGDIFRSFISAVIIIPLVLWISTDMGTLFTNFFLKYNLEMVEGYKKISSIGGGSNFVFWILLQIIKPIANLLLK